MIFKNIFIKSVYILFWQTGNQFIDSLFADIYHKPLRFFLDYIQFLNSDDSMKSLILVNLVKGLWYTT